MAKRSRTEDGHGAPLSSADPARPSRRSFLDWVLGTALGSLGVSVFYPVVHYLIPPREAEAAVSSVVAPFNASELAPNSGRIIRFGKRPAILVRTPGGELRCFDAVCTHLACTVQYREDLGHIWCACHNGHFDLHGRNIAGPPPRPLPAHGVRLRGEEIVITSEP